MPRSCSHAYRRARSGCAVLTRAAVVQAFNAPTYLEDLTGLTALRTATDELLAEWEHDDDPAAADIDDF